MSPSSFLILTAALITLCQCGTFSNASVVAYRLQVSVASTRGICAVLGGFPAMTHTRGYLSVVKQTTATSVNSAAPSFTVRLGAARTLNLWQWTSPPFQSPGVFSIGSQCITNVCVWAPGFPTANGDCLALADSVWKNFMCATLEAFACEIPYTSTFRCVLGNNLDTPAAVAYCAQRGWWLATMPNYASASAAYDDPSCVNLRALDFEYTLISMDDLKGPSRDFRWTRGPLGLESGGLGRLFSRGQLSDPTGIQRFGFDGPDWDTRNPEPNNFGNNERCGNLYVKIRTLNDWACDKVTGSFMCEVPDVVAASVLSPCFPGTPAGSVVQVDSERTITGCTVNNKLLVSATLRASRVTFVNTTIVVIGSAAAAITLDIAASDMTNSAIAVTGTLSSSSTVSVSATRVTSTARVEAMQPADTMVIITLIDLTLQQRASIAMTGNLVRMSQGNNIRLMHVASAINSFGASIELSDNQIDITATQGGTVLSGASGSSFIGGGLAIRRNTITVTAGGAAALWTEAAIAINGAADVSTNTVRLTGQSTILSSLGTVDLTGGTLSWAANTVTFTGASTIIAATISAAAGTEVTIANDMFVGTATATLLSAMTGEGTLTLQCNTLFNQLLDTPAAYAGHIPSVQNTEYIPCYTGPTTQPSRAPSTTFFEGLTQTTSGASASNSTTFIYAAAGAGAAVVIVIVIVIAFACGRRKRTVVAATPSHRSSSRNSKGSKSKRSRSSRRDSASARQSGTGTVGTTDASGVGMSSYTGADSSYAGGSSYTGADSSYAGGSSYTGATDSSYGSASYA